MRRLSHGACLFLLLLRAGTALHFSSTRSTEESRRAQAISSYAILRSLDTEQGPKAAMGNVIDALKNVSSYIGRLVDGKGFPIDLRYFIIVSQQRSGAGLVCSTLNAHPDIMCAQDEPYSFGTLTLGEQFNGSLERAFNATMDRAVAKLKNDSVPSNVRWFGIKIHENQVANVDGGFRRSDATLLFHFRRNVLRQIVSRTGSSQLEVFASAPSTFPLDSAAEVNATPTVKTVDLQCMIAHRIADRYNVVSRLSRFNAPVCPTSHYEDWLEAGSRQVAEDSIFKCLGVEAVPLAMPSQPEHSKLSLFETVRSLNEVIASLTGGPFEYMLENNGTASQIAEQLKQTDAYEVTPPKLEC